MGIVSKSIAQRIFDINHGHIIPAIVGDSYGILNGIITADGFFIDGFGNGQVRFLQRDGKGTPVRGKDLGAGICINGIHFQITAGKGAPDIHLVFDGNGVARSQLG